MPTTKGGWTPERRKARSEQTKKFWEDPKNREAMAEKTRIRMATKEAKQVIIDSNKRRECKPSTRKKMSVSQIARRRK